MHLRRQILLRFSTWLIVFGLAWSIGFVYNFNFNNELAWVLSIYKQKKQLSNASYSSSRILLVGGSGTHMGIDAYQMESVLKRPVYNMGLHAALGLNAILGSILSQIQPGDIIVVIPEYSLLADEDGVGRLAGRFGIATGQLDQLQMEWQEIGAELLALGTPTLRGLCSAFLTIIQNRQNSDYYSDRLDLRGSMVELKIRNPQAGNVQEDISSYNLEYLWSFKAQVETRGGSLIFSLPWILVSDLSEAEKTVQPIATKLRQIAPVLHNSTFNLQTDSALFADTLYHNSYQGRELRSAEMAEQLKLLISPRN